MGFMVLPRNRRQRKDFSNVYVDAITHNFNPTVIKKANALSIGFLRRAARAP